MDTARFNSKLLFSIWGILAVVGVRLIAETMKTDNWRGLFYTVVHLLIVAAGSYYAIRRSE